MKKYEKPVIEEVILDEEFFFIGCKSYADEDDSCFSGN